MCLNLMAGIFIGREKFQRTEHTRGDIEVTYLQAKECQGLLATSEAGTKQGGSSFRDARENMALPTP